MSDVETLVDRTRAVLRREIASYGSVSREAIRESVLQNLEAVRDALLLHPDGPAMRDFASLEVRMAQRADQGLPIQDMIQGTRASISSIQERFVEIAGSNGVAAEEMFTAARQLWALGDALAAHLAIVYQRTSVDDAVRESHLRTEFLRELLSGKLQGGDDLSGQAAAFGLDPEMRCYAIKSRPTNGSSLEYLRRDLERCRTNVAPAVVGVSGDVCIGVVPTIPSNEDSRLLAVGPEVSLQEVAKSFDTAARLFAWMDRRHRQGIAQLADVSWRLAVDRETEVTAFLELRYLTPLESFGEFGMQIRESLVAYLENDRHIVRAATSLFIHPNTLRYRLSKYADITGVDLDSLNDLFELSWAIEGNSR